MSAKLPKAIKQTDLKYTWDSEDRVVDQFELWNVNGIGWVIPTLDIAGAKRGYERRTYASRVDNGAVMRVGQGPHVSDTCTVYVTSSRQDALRPFLEIRDKGKLDANQIRDRISTRRAQGALIRNQWGF